MEIDKDRLIPNSLLNVYFYNSLFWSNVPNTLSVLQTHIMIALPFHKVYLYLSKRDPKTVPKNELCPHDKVELEAIITSKCLAWLGVSPVWGAKYNPARFVNS